MAVYNKYDAFVEDLGNKVHGLFGPGDQLNVLLSNRAPVPATDRLRAHAVEIAAANGYVAGGLDVQNNGVRTGGVLLVTAVDVVWTTSGPVGPFRYVVLFNITAAGGPLIAWWDYGAPVTLAASDSFTVDFGGNSLFTIT